MGCHRRKEVTLLRRAAQTCAVPWAAECGAQAAFMQRGVHAAGADNPGVETQPCLCRGLIQAGLERREAPERPPYADNILVLGNAAEKMFEKGKEESRSCQRWVLL